MSGSVTVEIPEPMHAVLRVIADDLAARFKQPKGSVDLETAVLCTLSEAIRFRCARFDKEAVR